MSQYKTTITTDKISLELNRTTNQLTLARTGGQGAQGPQGYMGDSIQSVEIVDNDLVLTIYESDTDSTRQINVGTIVKSEQQISDDWISREESSGLTFLYQNTSLMQLTGTGNLIVVGDINANTSITLPVTLDNSIHVGDWVIGHRNTTNTLVFGLSGQYFMELTSTGDLFVNGDITTAGTIS